MSLLVEQATNNKMNLLEVEKYQDTFGPKARRKKPKLDSLTYDAMYNEADHHFESYDINKDSNRLKHQI